MKAKLSARDTVLIQRLLKLQFKLLTKDYLMKSISNFYRKACDGRNNRETSLVYKGEVWCVIVKLLDKNGEYMLSAEQGQELYAT